MALMEHDVTGERKVAIPTKMKISEEHAQMLNDIERLLKEQLGFRPLKSELHVTIFEKGIEFYYEKMKK